MILLFGGNGQLGQELTRAAAARSVALTALSHAQVDISNRRAVRAIIGQVKPALVVNAAAYTKVDLAETEKDAAYDANGTGPAMLAVICTDIPVIHVSTDYVFDGTKTGAYVESDPVAPINVYGHSKMMGEDALRPAPLHVILRTSWVYGEFGSNFLKMMVRLAATKSELRVVTDQRGCPTATGDLADAILAIAPRAIAREPIWGTYHFAGTGVTTWHGFASRIVAAQAPLTGRAPPVVPIASAEFPTKARRPANSELDCSLFARTFGFRARTWEERTDAVTQLVARKSFETDSHVA